MTAFTLPACVLHTAADWAARATPTRTPLPVLQGLLIDADANGAEAGRVTVSGFNYELRGTITVPAEVTTPGRLLVSGRLLAAVAKAAGRREPFTLEHDGGPVHAHAGRARWTLPALPIADYPTLPEASQILGTVNAAALRRALRRVLPAVGRDKALENIKAVKLEADAHTLTLAGTDRYRLAAATLEWEPTDPQRPLDLLVPTSLADAMARGSGDDSESLTLLSGDGETLFGFSGADSLTLGRVIGLEFPRWRPLLPEPNGRHATISTAELGRAISQVAPAIEEVAQLTLTTSADTLTVTVAGDERSAEATMPISAAGEPISIVLDAAYLQDALTSVDAEQVTAHFGDTPTRPVLLHGDDPGGYQHLLMPVRVPGSR